MNNLPLAPLPPSPAPDDPAIAAWVRASTDGLPDGAKGPVVDPATEAAVAEAVDAWVAAMDALYAAVPNPSSTLIPGGPPPSTRTLRDG